MSKWLKRNVALGLILCLILETPPPLFAASPIIPHSSAAGLLSSQALAAASQVITPSLTGRKAFSWVKNLRPQLHLQTPEGISFPIQFAEGESGQSGEEDRSSLDLLTQQLNALQRRVEEILGPDYSNRQKPVWGVEAYLKGRTLVEQLLFRLMAELLDLPAEKDPIVREILSTLDRDVLPKMRDLNIGSAYTLPRSEDWLIFPLLPFYDDTALLMERVKGLARHSPRASALHLAFVGMHLRRNQTNRPERLDEEFIPLLLKGFLPQLRDLLKYRSSEGQDSPQQHMRYEMTRALLGGLLFLPEHTENYPHLFNQWMSDLHEDVPDAQNIIHDALRAFPEISPRHLPGFYLTSYNPLGFNEVVRMNHMNDQESKKISLWNLLTDPDKELQYRMYGRARNWDHVMGPDTHPDYRLVYNFLWSVGETPSGGPGIFSPSTPTSGNPGPPIRHFRFTSIRGLDWITGGAIAATGLALLASAKSSLAHSASLPGAFLIAGIVGNALTVAGAFFVKGKPEVPLVHIPSAHPPVPDGIHWLKTHHPELLNKTLIHVSPGIKPTPEFLDLFEGEAGVRVANGHQTGGLEPLVTEELAALADMGMNALGVTLLYQEAPMQRDDGGIEYRPIDYTAAIKKGELIELGRVRVPMEGHWEAINVFASRITGASGRSAAELYLSQPEINTHIYPDEQHRIRQMVLLGRGTLAIIKAIQERDPALDTKKLLEFGLPQPALDPGIVQMNEALAGFAHPKILDDAFTSDPGLNKLVYGFTTHTPVEAGLQKISHSYAESVRLHKDWQNREMLRNGTYDLTKMLISIADVTNGVSKEHAMVTVRQLYPMFKGWITGIVNGIYVPHWQLPRMSALVRQDYSKTSAQEMLAAHIEAKRALIAWLKSKLHIELDESKLFSGEIRRKTSFKSVDSFNLAMQNPALRDAFLQSDAIQIFAGKPHSDDHWGFARVRELKALMEGRIVKQHLISDYELTPAFLRQLRQEHTVIFQFSDNRWLIEEEIAKDERLKGRVVYLTNLNIKEAAILFQGMDILDMWSELPTEASATGYMKGLVNGIPTFATQTGGPLEHIRDFFDSDAEQTNGFFIRHYLANQRPAPEGIIEKLTAISKLHRKGREALSQGQWDTPWTRTMWNALQSTDAVNIVTTLQNYFGQLWGPQFKRKRILTEMHQGAGQVVEFKPFPETATVGNTKRFEVVIDLGQLDPHEVRVDLLVGTLTSPSQWHPMDWEPVYGQLGRYRYSTDITFNEHGTYEFTVSLTPANKDLFKDGAELRRVSRFTQAPHTVLVDHIPVPGTSVGSELKGAVLQIGGLSYGAHPEGNTIRPATAGDFRNRLKEILQQHWAGVYLNAVLPIGPLNRRMQKNERDGVPHPFYDLRDPQTGKRRLFVLQRWVNDHPETSHGSPFATTDPRGINPDWGTLDDVREFAAILRAAGRRLFHDIVPNHLGLDSPLLWESANWDLTVNVDPKKFLTPGQQAKFSEMNDFDLHNPDALKRAGLFDPLEQELNRHRLSLYNTLDYLIFYRTPGDSSSRIYMARGRDKRQKEAWADTVQLDYTKEKTRRFVLDTILFLAALGVDIRGDMTDLIQRLIFKEQWYHRMDWEAFNKLWPREFWEQVVEEALIPYPNLMMVLEAYDGLEYLHRVVPEEQSSARKRLLIYAKEFQHILAEGHVDGPRLKRYLENGPPKNSAFFLQDHDDPNGPWHRGYEHVKMAMVIMALAGAHLFVDARQMHGLQKLSATALPSPHETRPSVEEEFLNFHAHFIAPLHASPLVQETEKHMLHTSDPNLIAFRRTLGGQQMIMVANVSTDTTVEGVVYFDNEIMPSDPNSEWTFEDKYFPFRTAAEKARTTVQPVYIEKGNEIIQRSGKYVRLAPGGVHIFYMYPYPKRTVIPTANPVPEQLAAAA